MKAWSYSALDAFETCAKRYWHLTVKKDFREKKSDAQNEGTITHKSIEDYVLRGKELPIGLVHMKKIYEPYRQMRIEHPDKVYGEQKLAINGDYVPTGWFADDVWFRTIIDLMVVGDKTAVILDHKTGKVKTDMTQLELMAAVTFLVQPQLELVKAGYSWTKTGKITGKEVSAEDCIGVWNKILPRVAKLQEAFDTACFPPKPSGLCKRYCPVESCPHHGS